MKETFLHSRELLTSINLSPIDQDILAQLSEDRNISGCRCLIYECICRYLIRFSQKYHFPITCDMENIFLNKQAIWDENDFVKFIEKAEENSEEFLWELTYYCEWKYIRISNSDLLAYGISEEEEGAIQKKICDNFDLSDQAKALMCKMPGLVEETLSFEMEVLYILSIRGVKKYLKYREAHPDQISLKFGKEDRVIESILHHAKSILISACNPECCDEDEEDLVLGWTTNGDSYYYDSIGYLNPNWLISMYVLHDLLEHAQREFGY